MVPGGDDFLATYRVEEHDADGQFEQPPRALPLRFATLIHVREALRPAQQRADRKDREVIEAVVFAARDARVFEWVESANSRLKGELIVSMMRRLFYAIAQGAALRPETDETRSGAERKHVTVFIVGARGTMHGGDADGAPRGG